MQLAIDLPDAYVKMFDESKLKNQIRLSYALMLYRQEEVSISKAAEIAGMDLYDFMLECKRNSIPTLSTTPDELKSELETLGKII